MPYLLLLLAVLAAILVVNWRRLGLNSRFGGGRSCRWRRDPRQRGGNLQRWVCASCGVDAYVSDGRPPKECKRALRNTQL